MIYKKIKNGVWNEVWRCRDYAVTQSPEATINDFNENEEVVKITDLTTGQRPTIYKIIGECKGLKGYLTIKKHRQRKPYPYIHPSALGKIVKIHTECILW